MDFQCDNLSVETEMKYTGRKLKTASEVGH